MVEIMTYRARIGVFAGVKALPGFLKRSKSVIRKLKKRRRPIENLNLKISLWLGTVLLLVCICASSYQKPFDHPIHATHIDDKNALFGRAFVGSVIHRVIYQTSISLDGHLDHSMIKWKTDITSYSLSDLLLTHVLQMTRITQFDFALEPKMTKRTHIYSISSPPMTNPMHVDYSFISRLKHADSSRLSTVAKISQLRSPQVPAINMFTHLNSSLSTVIKLLRFPITMVNNTFLETLHTHTRTRRTQINFTDSSPYSKSSSLPTVRNTHSDISILNLMTSFKVLYFFLLSKIATCENCDTLLLVIPNITEKIQYLPLVSVMQTSVLNASVMLNVMHWDTFVLITMGRFAHLDSTTISTMVAGSSTCDYLLGNRGAHSYNGNPGREGSSASSNNRKEMISEQGNIKTIEVSNFIVIRKGCTWNDFTGQLICLERLSISDKQNIKIVVSCSGQSQSPATFSKNDDGIIYIVSSEDMAGNFNSRGGFSEDNVDTLILKMLKEGGDRDLPHDGTKITLPQQLGFKYCTKKDGVSERFIKNCTFDITTQGILIGNITSIDAVNATTGITLSRSMQPVDEIISQTGCLEFYSTSLGASYQLRNRRVVAEVELKCLFDSGETTEIMEQLFIGHRQNRLTFEISISPTRPMIKDGKFSTKSGDNRKNQILEEGEITKLDKHYVPCRLEDTIERASNNVAFAKNYSKHESYSIHTEATEFSPHHMQTNDHRNYSTNEVICLNLDGKHNNFNNCKNNRKHSEKLKKEDICKDDFQGHVKICSSRNLAEIAFTCIIFIYLENFKSILTEILMHHALELRKTSKLIKKDLLPASTFSAKKIVEWLSLPKHKRSEYLPCPDTSNVIAYPLGADLRSFMANTGKSKEQMLDNQWIRLSTFTGFPADSPVSTMRLSDAGFYYETVGTDEVICFKCGVKHKGWTANDIPVLVHKSISPSCEFIKNKTAPSVSEYGFDNSSHVQQRTENVIPVTEPQTSYSQTTGSVGGASGGPGDLHQLPSRLQSVELHSSSTQQNAETELEMSRPVVAGSKPPEISETAAGNPANFAFTQQNSATSDKMSGSIAQSYFGNNSGNARAAAPVANVPTTTQTTATSDATTKSKYPMYALYASRLQTYGGFPKDLNQKPEELSKAGFFYEGKNDNVRCFYCGGGLRDWEPEDDPWIEHARWYQKCEYLRKNKGDEFVRLVHNGQYELLRRELQKKKEAERRKTEVMQLPAVVSVIEMGYSENLVKRAYQRYTSENENTSVTADVLLQMVWQLEEEGENNLDLANETTTVERERSYTETSERPSFQASAEETQVQATSVASQSQAEEQIGPETVEEIEQENKILKEQQMCKICMEEEVAIVFLPCGHMVTCVSCAAAMRHCPLCRTFIRGTVKAIVC